MSNRRSSISRSTISARRLRGESLHGVEWVVTVRLRRVDHCDDRLAQIPAMACEHGVEAIEIGEIYSARHQDRVIQPDALDRARADRAKLRREYVEQR